MRYTASVGGSILIALSRSGLPCSLPHPLFPWRRLCAASFAGATLSAEWDERHRENTHDKQTIAHVKVCPGADGDFQLTHIHWDNAAHKLSLTGTKAWSNDAVVDIVRAK